MPPGSNNDQVGMVQPKCLRYVTVPANRRMGFKYFLKVIQMNFIPTHQLSSRAKKTRPMVQPVNFCESLSAIDAVLTAIPSH